MVIYVAHKFGGDYENIKKVRKITHDLQIADMANTYICPLLALSHIAYGEVGFDEEMECCIDLLSICDCLLVASEVSNGVQREIDFARLVGMEVRVLEDNGRG